MSNDHVCRPVFDADGNVIARARVSPDITGEELSTLAEVIAYAQKLQAEEDAADPEAAAGRRRRQDASRTRIRERNRRLRGEPS